MWLKKKQQHALSRPDKSFLSTTHIIFLISLMQKQNFVAFYYLINSIKWKGGLEHIIFADKKNPNKYFSYFSRKNTVSDLITVLCTY